MADLIASADVPIKSKPDSFIPYFAKTVTVWTDLTVPDNWFNLTKQNPTKYYKAAQITLLFESQVVYHTYINFELQNHGMYLMNPDAIMPVFVYKECYGSSEKCIDDRTQFESQEDEEGCRQVAKFKPYLLGWMKCFDEIYANVFADGITLGVNIRPVR
ncbi:MAG: hypothetical protein VKK42_25970 [Lyngbya sp.]|nr:hypothetical protein [Lyngbya sp.]